MRLLVSVAFLSVISQSAVMGQSPVDDSNIVCVERLAMPIYPKVLGQARLGGATVIATVLLDADGHVQSIVSDPRPKSQLFVPAVEEALRVSAFSANCGSKSVKLIFDFVLGERSDRSILSQTVSFGYPNRFWIETSPMLIEGGRPSKRVPNPR